MSCPMRAPFDKPTIESLLSLYRRQLLDECMSHWLRLSVDREYGGFFTGFDRQWNQTRFDKNMWCQGRQTYMFSALHTDLPGDSGCPDSSASGVSPAQPVHAAHKLCTPDPAGCHEQYRHTAMRLHSCWLDAAQLGRDFMCTHGYAGNGQWYYLLDRDGKVLNDKCSTFTAIFVLMGLCKYAQASGDNQDLSIIRDTFDAVSRTLMNRDFSQFHHFELSADYLWHGPYMGGLCMCAIARDTLGPDYVQPLTDYCLDMILNVFAKESHQALFEAVARDGSFVDTPQCRCLNPGHAIESAWFVAEEALYRNDPHILARAADIARWSLQRGWDESAGTAGLCREDVRLDRPGDTSTSGIDTTLGCGSTAGGILSFVDYRGGWADDMPAERFGERWNDRIWWVHSEALYATLLLAVYADRDESGCQSMANYFLRLHEYCQKHFVDHEYGDWYSYLHSDGTVKYPDKGDWIRCAFHMPRNLLKIIILLDKLR